MSLPIILVTGSNGQLGNELRELAPSYPRFRFLFLDRGQFPINEPGITEEVFGVYRPDYLINCAAYTAVDRAESETDLANEINGMAVGRLALLCRQYGTRFIHLSTDYVFDGKATAPLKETDQVNPVNAYGASKLLGEQLALRNDPDSIIVRTSWVYSFYGKNFVKTMIRLMGEKESIGVVNDQYGSPTYAADLAEAILQIISSGKWQGGLYHFSNEGAITWFDFASEIARLIHSTCRVRPVATAEFPTPARRPGYSVLDKTKIRSVFAISLKDWKESLRICIGKLNAGSVS